MDTPRIVTRSRHVPTPKMSDRKKSLFSTESGVDRRTREDSDLGPMSPLKFSNSPKRGPMKDLNITTFRNILGNASPESDRSLSPDFERRFSHSERYEILTPSNDKENQIVDEDTRLSFSSSTPRMRTLAESTLLDETNSNSLSKLMNSDLNIDEKKNPILKTPGLSEKGGQNLEPRRSFRKLSFQEDAFTPSDECKANSSSEFNSESRARTSLSFNNIRPISTKSFYSSNADAGNGRKSVPNLSPPNTIVSCRVPQRRSSSNPRKSGPSSKKRSNSIRLGGFNRGVFHKIKKPTNKTKVSNARVKKLSTSQILESTATLFDKSPPQATKPPVQSKSAPSSPQNPKPLKQQIERIRKILKDSRNPIEQARPLSLSKSMSNLANASLYNDDAHDGGTTDHDNEDENFDAKSEGGRSESGRKFFKSSSNRRIKREYKLVHNVTATVHKGGKVSLNKSKERKRKHVSLFDDEMDLASEQLEVDFLISKLLGSQDKPKADAVQPKQSTPKRSDLEFQSQTEPPVAAVQIEIIDAMHSEVSDDEPIPMQPNVIYVDRLSPLFNGTGGEDSSCSSTQEGTGAQLDYQESPTMQIRTMTSSLSITRAADVSDQLDTRPQTESNRLFPIFYKDHQRTVALQSRVEHDIIGHGLFDAIRDKPKRLRTSRGVGFNQYQIDAGQRQYGAQQCAGCGLLYSAHEPEEEMIHDNYHASLHILRFPGWNSEAVVAHVPEWDVSGRILAVGMTAGQHKLRKVQEVLTVVDRELGFGEPCQLVLGSVVYLAIARSTVLGVCVAQPQSHANRLLTIEGLEGSIDCCTMEAYPVKCGISRIWVSPSFRGHGIARTMLAVMRSHFVFGYQMSYDEIAFSAPTDAGKRLAESVTGRKDFLIYI
ncbi:N-acetyltransferase eco isoform X2 [Armigeres subalbatus]|uniref:N-acetyltransferase eco isoform X2 n=1 Tax=Armigeres subalbatus TaxID=124917 RepID=UPI002ED6424F